MKWQELRHYGETFYQLGKTSDENFIWPHEGRYHIAFGVSFENLDDAKAAVEERLDNAK